MAAAHFKLSVRWLFCRCCYLDNTNNNAYQETQFFHFNFILTLFNLHYLHKLHLLKTITEGLFVPNITTGEKVFANSVYKREEIICFMNKTDRTVLADFIIDAKPEYRRCIISPCNNLFLTAKVSKLFFIKTSLRVQSINRLKYKIKLAKQGILSIPYVRKKY